MCILHTGDLMAMVAKGDSRLDVKLFADAVLDEYYSGSKAFLSMRPEEWFFPIVTKVFYCEFGEKNPFMLNYLNGLLGSKMLSMANIPSTRREFTSYVVDERLSSSGSRGLSAKQRGDLSLFNSGILFVYNKSMRKVLDDRYYRAVGVKAYHDVVSSDDVHKRIFGDLSDNFVFYEAGFREVASRFIFGGPGEFLVNRLIDARSKAGVSHSEDDLLSALAVESRYSDGNSRTEKFGRLI